jgi:hypothetical protein
MSDIPFILELQYLFTQAFGNDIILYLIMGLLLFLIFAGMCKINILTSTALTLGIYIIYIIYLGVGFGWLMGIAVLIYGFILYGGLRRIFRV